MTELTCNYDVIDFVVVAKRRILDVIDFEFVAKRCIFDVIDSLQRRLLEGKVNGKQRGETKKERKTTTNVVQGH